MCLLAYEVPEKVLPGPANNPVVICLALPECKGSVVVTVCLKAPWVASLLLHFFPQQLRSAWPLQCVELPAGADTRPAAGFDSVGTDLLASACADHGMELARKNQDVNNISHVDETDENFENGGEHVTECAAGGYEDVPYDEGVDLLML